MNNTHKTLLITTALAARLLSVANVLSNTFVTTNSQQTEIDAVDGFTIEHDHADYGKQAIVADRLDDNTWVISFAGRQEFQELIGTNGWVSSAQALENYFLLLDPEFVPFFADLNVSYIGENKTLIALDLEDAASVDPRHLAEEGTVETVDVRGNLGERLLDEAINTVVGAVDEYSQTFERAAEADVEMLHEMHREDVIEPEPEAGAKASDTLRYKLGKTLRSPAGFIGCMVVAMVTACVIGEALRNKINSDAVPQV